MGAVFRDEGRMIQTGLHGFLCEGVILRKTANDVDSWKGFLDSSSCLDTVYAWHLHIHYDWRNKRIAISMAESPSVASPTKVMAEKRAQ